MSHLTSVKAEPDPVGAELEFVRCYLCAGQSFSPHLTVTDRAYGTPGTFHMARCNDCGLVLLNPRLPREEVFRRYPGDYVTNHLRVGLHRDTLWGRVLESMIVRGEKQRVNEIHKRHPVEEGTRILDVGCGNATFLHVAQTTRGADVVGVEVSSDCCRYAHDILGIDLVQEPFDSAEIDGPFDIITLWHYLEHEYDPLTTLARCALLLEPDGLLVVQVPNVESLGAHVFGRNWNGWDAPRHTVSFSRKTLSAMLCRARLEPTGCTAPANSWGALLSIRLALGLGLRLDPFAHFWSLAFANGLTMPFEVLSRLCGGEWITCYARRSERG